MQRRFPETFDQVKTASPFKRLGALLYDFMIIVALWMIIGFVAVAINHGEAQTSPMFHSLLFIITFCFFAFFWTRNGQTLGMLAWRLRVQTPEGEHLTLTQALIRFIVAGISIAPAGLGYLWMFFNKEKMAWHDLASKTCVVELPKPSKKAKAKKT
ncbi:RDD family protein [Pontibacterium sp.]|uniref:RDD family protein n=1 Tax=Pontibacterium sp. TaxID=2036026 RepID=UPI003563DB6A